MTSAKAYKLAYCVPVSETTSSPNTSSIRLGWHHLQQQLNSTRRNSHFSEHLVCLSGDQFLGLLQGRVRLRVLHVEVVDDLGNQRFLATAVIRSKSQNTERAVTKMPQIICATVRT
jgi:hypothetical protein